jgi:hypothetical protein
VYTSVSRVTGAVGTGPRKELVRKSFGPDRRAAVEWVEEMRVTRRTGQLPTSAKRAQEPSIQKDEVVTVATLCTAFLAYIKSHPEEYRDQKNPPRRIEEIRNAFEGRVAAKITPPEIEEWLAAVQENRELANGTINKLRGTFSMLYKHGKRKGLTEVNPAEELPPQGHRQRCREVPVAGRGAKSARGHHPKNRGV